MTATQVQFRRGTKAQTDTFTGAAGEMTVDTTNNRLVAHDGATAGGFPQGNAKSAQNNEFNYAVAGGTGDAITLTFSPALAGYVDGGEIKFRVTAANTGAVTINVNSLGNRALKKQVGASLSAMAGNDLAVGVIYSAIFSSASNEYVLQSGSGGGAGLLSISTFTASGTWTRPAGCTKVKVIVTGGGGGGAGTGSGLATGGGGGATSIKVVDVSAIASVIVTVGGGGTGDPSSAGTNDTNGGNSTFGSHCTGGGGIRGSSGGAGGTASNGDANISGGRSAPTIGLGGGSYWGTGGVPTSGGATPITPDPFGAGGAGGNSSNGGAGKAGIVIVEEYGT